MHTNLMTLKSGNPPATEPLFGSNGPKYWVAPKYSLFAALFEIASQGNHSATAEDACRAKNIPYGFNVMSSVPVLLLVRFTVCLLNTLANGMTVSRGIGLKSATGLSAKRHFK